MRRFLATPIAMAFDPSCIAIGTKLHCISGEEQEKPEKGEIWLIIYKQGLDKKELMARLLS